MRLVPAIGDQLRLHHRPVALREQRRVVAGQIDPPFVTIRVVARNAVPVENRLDVAREVEHIGASGDRLDPARRTPQGQQIPLGIGGSVRCSWQPTQPVVSPGCT